MVLGFISDVNLNLSLVTEKINCWFSGVSQVAGHLTPVPGGVGPMTVAMLLKNTVLAYRLQLQDGSISSQDKWFKK